MIDENTLAVEFRHFPQFLVDLDLSSHFPESIMSNRSGDSVTVGLFY